MKPESGENYAFLVDETQEGMRLDRFLSDAVEGLSRSRVAKLIVGACVELEGGAAARGSYRVHGGEAVRLRVPALRDALGAPQPQALPFELLYEDESLLVVNKAAHMAVHPAPGTPDGTLVNAILYWVPALPGIGGERRPGIVHRLDKDTTGAMVVAKTDAALQNLQAQFKARSVDKVYVALAYRGPREESGIIDTPIARHPKDRKRYTSLRCEDRADAREARTHWRVLRRFPAAVMIELKLETGRTHQIRVHLLDMGCPVLGDKVYGGRGRGRRAPAIEAAEKLLGRQALHARQLCFTHPVTEERLCFEAPYPKDFEQARLALEGLE